MYAYKIKQFLLAFALGMTVSSPWDGCFNANGGYIVVDLLPLMLYILYLVR